MNNALYRKMRSFQQNYPNLYGTLRNAFDNFSHSNFVKNDLLSLEHVNCVAVTIVQKNGVMSKKEINLKDKILLSNDIDCTSGLCSIEVTVTGHLEIKTYIMDVVNKSYIYECSNGVY